MRSRLSKFGNFKFKDIMKIKIFQKLGKSLHRLKDRMPLMVNQWFWRSSDLKKLTAEDEDEDKDDDMNPLI